MTGLQVSSVWLFASSAQIVVLSRVEERRLSFNMTYIQSMPRFVSFNHPILAVACDPSQNDAFC